MSTAGTPVWFEHAACADPDLEVDFFPRKPACCAQVGPATERRRCESPRAGDGLLCGKHRAMAAAVVYRDEGGDNHGAAAKAVCAGCPVWRECLTDAIDRREDHGIWGGAGEDLRRLLIRKRRAGGEVWEAAMVAHEARLAGVAAGVPNRNGPKATHGLRVTYARGCRCGPCRMAATDDDLDDVA